MKNLYRQFQPIGKLWLLNLNNYNEVPFKRKTSKIRWSLSEIYGHLCHSTLDFHLKGLEECFVNPQTGGKSLGGKLVFLRRSFDNKKLKAFMEKEYAPTEIEGIGVTRNQVIRVLKQMDEWGEKILTIDKQHKAKHPVLGYLSACEWYRLVIFHFEYHTKNKNKIDKFITS
jgi:hypothetical protein